MQKESAVDLPVDNKLAKQVAFIDYLTESVWSPGRGSDAVENSLKDNSTSVATPQNQSRSDEVTYLREQVAIMSQVNAVEIEKEHELQIDINEANCRICELVNGLKIKEDECRALRDEKDKYWSQLVFSMREKSDSSAIIANLHQELASKETEFSRSISALHIENQKRLSLLEEEKAKTISLAKTVATSFQRNKSLQSELDGKNTELIAANKEIENLLQKLQLRDAHVEQLNKAFEKLYREQHMGSIVPKSKERRERHSIGSISGIINSTQQTINGIASQPTTIATNNNNSSKNQPLGHSRSDSTDSAQSITSVLSVLVGAKEVDPDKEALSLGMLLSQQMKEFGTTMFDALRAGDEEVLEEYRLGGFSREEAALLLFEERFGKVSTQHSIIHPALPHTQIIADTVSVSNKGVSPSFQSPTKIEQLIAASSTSSLSSVASSTSHIRSSSLNTNKASNTSSNTATYLPRSMDTFRTVMNAEQQQYQQLPQHYHQQHSQLQQQQQQQGGGGPRTIQFVRPTLDNSEQDDRRNSRGHRNWNSTSDLGAVFVNRR